MRQILFKGKDKQNGCWVDGSLVIDCLGLYVVHQPETNEPWHIIEIIPETVSQYTGSTDKNGIQIFENDICKVGSFLYKVVFSYGQWNFEIIDDKYYYCPCFYSNCKKYCEVIGNIFDNPELLK